MGHDKQVSGMAGVFAVAEQLSLRGWIVSPTSRNVEVVDLLMTRGVGGTLAGQVKTNGIRTGDSFWLVGKKALTPHQSLFYFFVKFHKNDTKDIYVVPSKTVSKIVTVEKSPNSTWYSVSRDDIAKFKDMFDFLEGSTAKETLS